MTITSNTLVTVDEAAEELDIPAYMVRTWLCRGHIHRMGTRPQSIGRPKTLVDIEEVRRFIVSRQK